MPNTRARVEFDKGELTLLCSDAPFFAAGLAYKLALRFNEDIYKTNFASSISFVSSSNTLNNILK